MAFGVGGCAGILAGSQERQKEKWSSGKEIIEFLPVHNLDALFLIFPGKPCFKIYY